MARTPAPRLGRRLPDEPQIPNEEIRYALGESVLGPVLVASSDKGVVSIQLGHDAEQLLDRKSTRLNSSHYSRSRMPSSA